MSVWDNKTKIYPDLNPSVSKEPQTYRLYKLSEIQAYFLMKLKPMNRLPRK